MTKLGPLLLLVAGAARAEGPPVAVGAQLAGALDARSRTVLLRPGLVVETRAGAVRFSFGASEALAEFPSANAPAHEVRGDFAAAWELPLGSGTVDVGLGAIAGATLAWFRSPAEGDELFAFPAVGGKALAGVSVSAGERAALRVALQTEGVWTRVTLPSWTWLPSALFDLRVLAVASFTWRLR